MRLEQPLGAKVAGSGKSVCFENRPEKSRMRGGWHHTWKGRRSESSDLTSSAPPVTSPGGLPLLMALGALPSPPLPSLGILCLYMLF